MQWPSKWPSKLASKWAPYGPQNGSPKIIIESLSFVSLFKHLSIILTQFGEVWIFLRCYFSWVLKHMLGINIIQCNGSASVYFQEHFKVYEWTFKFSWVSATYKCFWCSWFGKNWKNCLMINLWLISEMNCKMSKSLIRNVNQYSVLSQSDLNTIIWILGSSRPSAAGP